MKIFVSLLTAGAVFLTGCVTDPATGKQVLSATAKADAQVVANLAVGTITAALAGASSEAISAELQAIAPGATISQKQVAQNVAFSAMNQAQAYVGQSLPASLLALGIGSPSTAVNTAVGSAISTNAPVITQDTVNAIATAGLALGPTPAPAASPSPSPK